MKLSARTAVRFAISLAVSTLLLTALRIIAYYARFRAEIGYFDSGWFSSLLYIVPCLLALAGMVVAYLRSPTLPFKKPFSKTRAQKKEERKAAKARKQHVNALKKADIPIPPTPLPYLDPAPARPIGSLPLAVNLLCAAAFACAALFDVAIPDPLYRVRMLAALLAAVAFLLPIHGHALSRLSQLLHLAPIAWCVICVATEYFDWNHPMNGPTKVYTQFALCCAALYVSAYARTAAADFNLCRQNAFAVPAIVFGFSAGCTGLAVLPAGMAPVYLTPFFLVSLAVSLHAALNVLPALRGEVARIVVPEVTLPPLPKKADDTTSAKTEKSEDTP